MGLSLEDRVATLPAEEREAWLAELPDFLLTEMARGEWWWVSRPEQVPPPGDWMICLALAGRGFGKALSLDTLIPTRSSGFKRMADITVGETVFDENGHPCTVTATFDSFPSTAYRVTFSDGLFIEACGDHQWVTWDWTSRAFYGRNRFEADAQVWPPDWPNWRPLKAWRDRPPRRQPDGPGPRVRTTQEIAETLLTTHTRPVSNHCIPLAGNLVLPAKQLLVDPWILGYWLGNGSSKNGTLTMHLDDLDFVVGQIVRAGYRYNIYPPDPGGRKVAKVGVLGLMVQLRELGILGSGAKDVPENYLWASVEQRKALLAGLIDSDGHCHHKTSRAEFTSTNIHLARGVLHLLRSLGQKPYIHESEPQTGDGYNRQPSTRVVWRPTFSPFHMPRKAANYKPPSSHGLTSRHRMIKAVDRITPAPMRCLTVDSPNSLYLAGEGMIPTHNTRAGAEWIVSQVLKHPYDSHGVPTEWLVVAETLSDARTICMEGPAGVIRVLERRKIKHRFRQSPRPMILFPDGAKIYTEGADDPDVGRGYNCSGSWLDEIAKWKYPKASWDSGIMPSLRADLVGDHPRAFVTTTPKPIDLLQEWVKRNDETIHVIRGSTFDNSANLSQLVIRELRKRYDNTLVGRQELYGEMIEGFEGALFRQLDIENNRLSEIPDLVNIVVGVDPSLTGEDDEMGIVVVGRDKDNHMYVLEDASLMGVGRTAALDAWRVVARWGADKLVCEVNLGKRWMQQVFNDAYYELVGQGMFEKNTKPPLIGIDTKIGKKTRGEPVAMRNEQGRLHNVGIFPELEAQMATFTSWGTSDSPDRLDALVHACRFLIEGEKKQARISSPQDVLSSTLQSLWAEVGSYRADF